MRKYAVLHHLSEARLSCPVFFFAYPIVHYILRTPRVYFDRSSRNLAKTSNILTIRINVTKQSLS